MSTELEAASYEDTPAGWQRRWKMEIDAAKKEYAPWHEQGGKIAKLFMDERPDNLKSSSRYGLFASNILTQRAMMLGRIPPPVSVERRFADAMDDVARVGGEMLERVLNADVQRDSDSYAQALKAAYMDWRLAGLAVARVRYVAEFEVVPATPEVLDEATGLEVAPAVPESERKTFEDAETDYVHWRDFLMSAGSRTWGEVRWVAFRTPMTREKLVERFPEHGKDAPLGIKAATTSSKANEDQTAHPWSRAEVWEVWDKDTKQVFWFVDGYSVVLDQKADPLQLEGFWPCPEPLMANCTTEKLVPRPDYVLTQDLYEQADIIATRIRLLTEAVRVAGVYDKSLSADGGITQMLSGGAQNKLYPVDNWAAFAEKGGVKGVIDWLPLDAIVAAIQVLNEQLDRTIAAIHQITGMSDIMRGQAQAPGATATEQRAKVMFGSVRIQAQQDEFARFASDIQKLKAEIISKHFDPGTIVQRSNIMFTEDGKNAELVQQAIAFIKDRYFCYRVHVKPESISLTDFSALRQERLEVLDSVTRFFQSMGPAVELLGPSAKPLMLKSLQWVMSGLKGASGFEAILDPAIAESEQQAQQAAQQPPPPDPKVIAAQMKAQADQQKGQLEMAKIDKELQADAFRNQLDVQAELLKQKAQADENIRERMVDARESIREEEAKARLAPKPAPGGPKQ